MQANHQLATFTRITAGVMLLLALGSWPYSYYQLLRIVVCVGSFYLAWYHSEKKQNGWIWPFAVTGIIFNPLAPLYLDKSVWQLIDIASAVLFFSSLSTEKSKKRQI